MPPVESCFELAYTVGATPVRGFGIRVVPAAFDDPQFCERLRALFHDDDGTAIVQELLLEGLDTKFDLADLREILEAAPPEDGWRIGETLAADYLQSERGYSFPWPTSRDARNLNASLAGTDQVGFRNCDDGLTRLAFGETKTSGSQGRPPRVLSGRGGLVDQLLQRAPDKRGCAGLIKYMALQCRGEQGEIFKRALNQFYEDDKHPELVGVVVRTIDADPEDLRSRVATLARNWKRRDLDLFALYVPADAFQKLRQAWNP